METKVEQVKAERIRSSPYQPREKFDEAKMDELYESILESGLLMPLIVRRVKAEGVKPGTEVEVIELVAGERRLRAAKMAGMDTVPVIVRDLNDREAAKICLLENIQREDLTLVEEARSFGMMRDRFGLSQGEIGEELGLDKTYVSRRLRLLELPEAALAAVEAGTLSLQTADRLAVIDEDQRGQALEDLRRGGLDSGELTQRAAVGILERMYIEPQKVSRKWEETREEVEDLLPECEWQPLLQAEALMRWDSGYEGVNAKPKGYLLTDGCDDDTPTWGELATTHGLRPKTAAEYLDAYDECSDEDLADVDGFVVGPFRVLPVVATKLLIEAENTAAEAAGRPSIFKSGHKAEEASEEELAKQAEEAAEWKRKQTERRQEALELARQVLAGEVSMEKEKQLAVRCFEEFLENMGDDLVAWFGDLKHDAAEEELDKVRKKLVAQLRKNGYAGGMGALGRLRWIEEMLSYGIRGTDAAELHELGLLKKFPALAEQAEEYLAEKEMAGED